jgi:hypothetical protein
VTRLRDPQTRLDHLEHGEHSLRARLQSSYQRLSPESARMFRLLGRLDTAEFSLHDASTLLRLDPDEAEQLVENLVDAHLLEGIPSVDKDEVRYQFQPLLRAFAVELDRSEVRTAEAAPSPRLVGKPAKPELRFAI